MKNWGDLYNLKIRNRGIFSVGGVLRGCVLVGTEHLMPIRRVRRGQLQVEGGGL